jgi:predicted FMN-binding regulatory protein PaiB
VTSIEGKWKLSQNRPEQYIAGVISAQGPGDAVAVAHEMSAMVSRSR